MAPATGPGLTVTKGNRRSFYNTTPREGVPVNSPSRDWARIMISLLDETVIEDEEHHPEEFQCIHIGYFRRQPKKSKPISLTSTPSTSPQVSKPPSPSGSPPPPPSSKRKRTPSPKKRTPSPKGRSAVFAPGFSGTSGIRKPRSRGLIGATTSRRQLLRQSTINFKPNSTDCSTTKWRFQGLGEIRLISRNGSVEQKSKMTKLALSIDSLDIATSPLVERAVMRAWIDLVNVRGDGNCGYRVLWEMLMDVARKPDGSTINSPAIRYADRQLDQHKDVRAQLHGFFTDHQQHYINSQFLGNTTVHSHSLRLQRPANDPITDTSQFFSLTMDIQLFCDKYQAMVLLLRGGKTSKFELHHPTRDFSVQTKSRRNFTAAECLDKDAMSLFGFWSFDGHAQYLRFNDSPSFRNWIKSQLANPNTKEKKVVAMSYTTQK